MIQTSPNQIITNNANDSDASLFTCCGANISNGFKSATLDSLLVWLVHGRYKQLFNSVYLMKHYFFDLPKLHQRTQ